MIERYIEISCDVCGEPEWSAADMPMREFKRIGLIGWRHYRGKSMCVGCAKAGKTWVHATLHDVNNLV